MWDNSLFDNAFDAAGLRGPVTLLKGGQPTFQARFERPQQILVDDQVHTTDYSIEYTTRDVPQIVADDRIRIDAEDWTPLDAGTYRVIQPPVVQGDGHWTIALLEKV